MTPGIDWQRRSTGYDSLSTYVDHQCLSAGTRVTVEEIVHLRCAFFDNDAFPATQGHRRKDPSLQSHGTGKIERCGVGDADEAGAVEHQRIAVFSLRCPADPTGESTRVVVAGGVEDRCTAALVERIRGYKTGSSVDHKGHSVGGAATGRGIKDCYLCASHLGNVAGWNGCRELCATQEGGSLVRSVPAHNRA